MAAIREAGGSGKAKLVSAQDKRNEARKKKQEEKEKAAGGGTDMMADLKNSLAMRRRVRYLTIYSIIICLRWDELYCETHCLFSHCPSIFIGNFWDE